MPTERIIPHDSDALTFLRGAARTLAAAATRRLDRKGSEPGRPGRNPRLRRQLPSLEAWLFAGCIVTVLWAAGWL